MLEKILSLGIKDYYKAEKDGNKIIIGVWNHFDKKTIAEIEEGLQVADISEYLKPKYSLNSICAEPLGNLFDLQIYKFGSILESKNYNLFEYDYLIKGNIKPLKSLLNACICKDREGSYFYIAVEPFSSGVSKKDIEEIERYITLNYREIEEKLNMNYSHIEIY